MTDVSRTLAFPVACRAQGITAIHAARVLAAMAQGGGDADGAERGGQNGASADLTGCCVLICEDEPMIGYDIAYSVQDAGGEAVGPFASVTDALRQLEERLPDAAILDVNLIDGDVTPVLQRLLEEGIPVVVNTGTKIPDEVEGADVPVFIKPTKPEMLIEAIS